ncbi:MAG TPA: tetratricopeptide repeat protein, partial [bacterium]|nr:tetratricopeptide repeat protein [bacterium]
YAITEISEHIMLTKDIIITWSDYKREDEEMTFGLLSQISPDGKYAISTVKDRSVFVAKPDPYYSQLFFPLKGILAYYSVENGTFHDLPGANDKSFVQSNPSWSPDGKYIIFAKSPADTLKKYGKGVLLSLEQCEEYITGRKKFRYDLYRIPFNDGKGGKAEPIQGASNNGMSNYFAKYSPDGKWIVFCKADSFMLLQPDSKLYIMPVEGGQAREMNCNTNRMNSWHSWSPNGKWLVFSSKVFSPYTQLFLTHIDEDGNDTPPVLLSNFTSSDRAVNIPEFVNMNSEKLVKMHEQFKDDHTYVKSGALFGEIFENYDKAEELYLKALELNPENINAHHRLGNIYMKKEEYDKAETEFNIILDKYPEYEYVHYAHYQLGIIFKNRNEFDRAEKEFRTVLKLVPDNIFSHHEIGYNYMRKKEYDKAEKVFLGIFKLIQDKEEKDPDAVTGASIKIFRTRAHANLGNVYFHKKEYDKAEKEFKAVIELDPNIFMGYISLGNVYVKSGEYKLAIREFEKALNINPSAPGLKKDILKLKQISMSK